MVLFGKRCQRLLNFAARSRSVSLRTNWKLQLNSFFAELFVSTRSKVVKKPGSNKLFKADFSILMLTLSIEIHKGISVILVHDFPNFFSSPNFSDQLMMRHLDDATISGLDFSWLPVFDLEIPLTPKSCDFLRTNFFSIISSEKFRMIFFQIFSSCSFGQWTEVSSFFSGRVFLLG